MRHKVLELESKRIQAIDRKLKNYSFQRPDQQQKRSDLYPLMNSERINLRYDHHKTLLLRDANRLDQSLHNNHSTLNSASNRRHSSHPLFLNRIWTNDNHGQKSEPSKLEFDTKQTNFSADDVNNSPGIVLFVTEPEENYQEEDTLKSSRFKVEKVKDVA